MIKKWFIIFLVFFLGTSALITVDQACWDATGEGGNTGLSVSKTADGDISLSFFGMEVEL